MLKKNLIITCFLSFIMGWITIDCQIGPQGDLDLDGILNEDDLDQDNDGILNCEEGYSGGVYLTNPFTTVPLDLYPNSLVKYTGEIVAGDPAAVQNVASDADGNFGLATSTNEGFSYQFNTNMPVDLTVEPYTANVSGVFTTNDRITFSSDVPITLNNPVGHLQVSTDGGSTWTTPSTFTATSILFRPIAGISAIGAANFDFTMTGATSFTYAMASTGGNPNGSTFRMLVGDCSFIDTDGDGIPNAMDLDSDNDGCPDSIEGTASFTLSDVNLDGSLPGAVDASGIPLVAGAGQDIGEAYNPDVVVCCDPVASGYPDVDSDGVSDLCDLDNDNDGILDSDEAPQCFLNQEVVYYASTVSPKENTVLLSQDVSTGIITEVVPAKAVFPGISSDTLLVNFNGIAYNKEDNIIYGHLHSIKSRVVYYDLNTGTWGEVIDIPGANLDSGSGAYFSNTLYIGDAGNDLYTVEMAPGGLTGLSYTLFAENPFGEPEDQNQQANWGDIAFGKGCNGGLSLFMITAAKGLYVIDMATATAEGNVGTEIHGPYGANFQLGYLGSLEEGTLIGSQNGTNHIYEIDICTGELGDILIQAGSSNMPDLASSITDENCSVLFDYDGDGIPNNLDLDSDDDGCPDSIEGGGGFTYNDINEDTTLIGEIDQEGVPTNPNSPQAVGESQNTEENTCICFGDPNSDSADLTVVGISTLNRHLNQGETQWPKDVKSALLAVDSQEKGLVITRLTQAQIDALTMQEGMIVYNIDEDCLMLCDGISWFCVKQTCADVL